MGNQETVAAASSHGPGYIPTSPDQTIGQTVLRADGTQGEAGSGTSVLTSIMAGAHQHVHILHQGDERS